MTNNQIPQIAPTAHIAPQSVIVGDVTIGENTSIFYYSVLRGDDAPITVGSGTNIQENCTVHTSTGSPTVIGDRVTIGHNAVIHACTIGDESLIGMGAIILDGAVVGRRCLIAAGSLVTKHTQIPDGMLVMGSPAKVKRPLTESEIKGLLDSSSEYACTGKRLFGNIG